MRKPKAIQVVRPGWWKRIDGSAEATRYTLNDTGGSWWGWVVRSTTDRNSYSDPIRTKIKALKQLGTWGE